MSKISESMERQGYIPLSDNGNMGVGFTPKIGEKNRRLAMPKWYDTGLKMPDGTPRTVRAADEAEAQEYENKGWKEVKPKKEKGGKE